MTIPIWDVAPCPFCGARMVMVREGTFSHPGKSPRLGGDCLLGGYGWRMELAEFWNARAALSRAQVQP